MTGTDDQSARDYSPAARSDRRERAARRREILAHVWERFVEEPLIAVVRPVLLGGTLENLVIYHRSDEVLLASGSLLNILRLHYRHSL